MKNFTLFTTTAISNLLALFGMKMLIKSNRFKVNALGILTLILLFGANVMNGQTIAPAGTYTQNFDAIGPSQTAALPTGWKAEAIATERTVTTAYTSVAGTATAYALANGSAMSSTAGNGIYNFGNGSTTADRTVGGLSSGSASKSVNMFVKLTNSSATASIPSFTVTYDAKRFRNGSNSAGFSIRLYYSTTGAASSWAEITAGALSFSANANNNGSTTNPSETKTATNIALAKSLAASGSIYFAWSYSVTSGIITSNAQALGIDNITIAAVSTTPTISGATTATAFTTTYGTASAAQSFSVSGSNLTANLIASAPTGFEVSSDGTTYGSTATFNQSSGAASGTLRVRLAATASVTGTSYNSQNISLASTGATTVNIATASSGNSVTAKALTITASNQNKTYNTSQTTPVTGSTNFTSSGLQNSETIGSVTLSYSATSALNATGTTGSTSTITPSAATGGTFTSSNYAISFSTGTLTVVKATPTITTIPTASAITQGQALSASTLSSGVASVAGSFVFTTPLTVPGSTGAYSAGFTFTPTDGTNYNTTSGTVSVQVNPGSSPTLTATTLSSSLSNTYGTASTGVSFTASGLNLTGTITATAQTGYEVSTDNSSYSSSVSIASGTSVYVRFAASTNAGTYNTATAVVISDGGASGPANITTSASGNTVSQKALTIGTPTIASKVYDATTTAGAVTVGLLSGFVGSETVTATATAAAYTSANVGSYASTVITYILADGTNGGLAANYSLATGSATGVITAKVLSITTPTIASKVYDGTTIAGTVTVGTLSGFVSTQTVTATATAAAYTSANVGSYASTDITYSLVNGTNGGLATNYTLANGSATGGITAKALSITAPTIASKVYDGTTTAGAVTVGTLSGFISTQTVTATATAAAYASANVGSSSTVVTYTLSNGTNGGLATNYTLANTTATGNITAVTLSISTASIASKTYDGSTTSGTVTAGTLTGFVGIETVSITSATGNYPDANVGTAKTATITYVLVNGSNGGLAANYALATTSANGDITTKPLTVTANDVTKEVGTTLTGGAGSTAFTSNGLVPGQTIGTVTITYGTGADAGAAVGTYTSQITPSLANGGTFITSNYSITYVAGDIIVQNTTSIVLTNMGSAVVEDFNSMGSSGTASLPLGIRVGNDFTTATSNATLTFGTSGNGSVTGTSSGGIINWANGVRNAATDRALGFLNTGSFPGPQSIVVSILNTTGNTINSLEIDWDYEKYRSGSRAFDWTFFHGNITNPSEAATEGNQSYNADADNTIVFNPPTSISKTVTLNNLSIEVGQRYYFLWTFTGNGGSSNGQGIGIDNFSIKPCRTTSITTQPSTSAQSTCLNGDAFTPLSITASGTDIVFQWEQSGDGLTGWTAAVGGIGGTTNSFTPSNVSAGTYYYRCVITNGCGEIVISGISGAISVSNNTSWVGTNGNWNTASNWSCGTVPTAGDTIIISSGTPTLNVDFTVSAGGSLTLSDTGALIISSHASLTVAGTAAFNARPITFKSDANGTAAFGEVTGTVTGATNVTVERHFPAKRAFRFATSAVTTTTSIKSNWQEGVNNADTVYANNQNPNPGYGTHITGTGGSTNGFDTTVSNSASMFGFNNTTAAWTAVTNTSNNLLTAGTPYRINIRGSRSVDMSLASPAASATTIRATGALAIGTVSAGTLSSSAYAYNFIGNPYQAPVDIKMVIAGSTNISNTFYYVWDPTRNTRGAYVSVDLSTQNGTPNIGSPAEPGSANKFLQPGQACFIRTSTSGTSPVMNFQESYKDLSGSNNLVFRNSNQSNSATSNIKMRLYDSNSLALNQTALDGSLVFFDDLYNNGVDQNDGAKFTNPDEMFSIFNNGALISIEKRMQPTSADIIPIRISQYRGTNYTIVAQGENLNGIPAYLHDQFLQTYTEIPQSGTVNYPYTIVTTNTQTTASDRFRIVYTNPLLNTNNTEWMNFTMYPNPSKQGNFNIILPQQINNAKVTIYTTLGKEIYTQNIDAALQTTITPKQQLATGIYYVELEFESNKSVKKLIIE